MKSFEFYLNTAQKSLFRFEGLQDYSGTDGDELINDFIKTGKLSEFPQDSTWWQDIKNKNENRILTARVRYVKEPLNNYTRWELAWHNEAARFSGDNICIIKEKELKEISSEVIPDFWLIDNTYVFILNYGPRGKYLGSQMLKGNELEKYISLKNMLLENSVGIISIKNYD